MQQIRKCPTKLHIITFGKKLYLAFTFCGFLSSHTMTTNPRCGIVQAIKLLSDDCGTGF